MLGWSESLQQGLAGGDVGVLCLQPAVILGCGAKRVDTLIPPQVVVASGKGIIRPPVDKTHQATVVRNRRQSGACVLLCVTGAGISGLPMVAPMRC